MLSPSPTRAPPVVACWGLSRFHVPFWWRRCTGFRGCWFSVIPPATPYGSMENGEGGEGRAKPGREASKQVSVRNDSSKDASSPTPIALPCCIGNKSASTSVALRGDGNCLCPPPLGVPLSCPVSASPLVWDKKVTLKVSLQLCIRATEERRKRESFL